MYVFVGCDDLVNTVFELAKSLSRLQLSEEEMALFSAAVLLAPGETLTPMSATNLATHSLKKRFLKLGLCANMCHGQTCTVA